jgi:hypothetical protein
MKKTQRPWTAEQDANLVAHYTHGPIPELATILGHTILGVHRRARFLGRLRAWTLATQAIRHDYFSALDTPLKAYILGLLAADGSVSSDEPRIRLAPHTPLQSKGVAIRIGISSQQLVADLARYRVAPRKSYYLVWPDLLPTALGVFVGLFRWRRQLGRYAA